MTDEIKIIVKPLEEGFAVYIVEPDAKEPMTDKMASCYTLARGMIKFGLDTPDIAFDYGMLSFREYAKRNKSNELLSKAIRECQEIDIKSGILTGNCDGLD